MSEQKLLTVREAATLIGVAQATLRKWTSAGHLDVTRTPGGHRRYTLEAVQAFIESGLSEPEMSAVGTRTSYGAYRPVRALLALPALLFGGFQGLFEMVSAIA